MTETHAGFGRADLRELSAGGKDFTPDELAEAVLDNGYGTPVPLELPLLPAKIGWIILERYTEQVTLTGVNVMISVAHLNPMVVWFGIVCIKFAL